MKEDRFDHRRIPGKINQEFMILSGRKILTANLQMMNLKQGIFHKQNQNTCAKSDPSLCYVKPTTLYDSAYGIWAFWC